MEIANGKVILSMSKAKEKLDKKELDILKSLLKGFKKYNGISKNKVVIKLEDLLSELSLLELQMFDTVTKNLK